MGNVLLTDFDVSERVWHCFGVIEEIQDFAIEHNFFKIENLVGSVEVVFITLLDEKQISKENSGCNEGRRVRALFLK